MPWPEEALIEVANKFLTQVELPSGNVRKGLANLCGYAHSVSQQSATRMQKELKRVFYVTPTNFIVLLNGYTQMLAEKRFKLGSQADKLKNGLYKLEQAREDVKIMTQESDIKRTEVTKKS